MKPKKQLSKKDDKNKNQDKAPAKPPVRNQTATQTNTIGPYMVPIIPQVPVLRRTSPCEDLLWTLQGVKTLIEQQNLLISQFKYTFATGDKFNDTLATSDKSNSTE